MIASFVLDGLGLVAGGLVLDGVVLETSPVYEPTTEELLVSLVLGVIVGSGLAYHAYTTGRNAIIWGIAGFFFSLLAAVVYALYVVLSSSSSEEPAQLEPRTNPSDTAANWSQETDTAAEPDRDKPAARSAREGPAVSADSSARESVSDQDASTTARATSDADRATSDADNQWRRVALEVESSSATGATAAETSDDDRRPSSTHRLQSTEQRAEAAHATDSEPRDATGSAQHAHQPTLVVKLTHGDGRSYVRSDVTEITRQEDRIVLTDADGSTSAYENAQIQHVWRSTDQ